MATRRRRSTRLVGRDYSANGPYFLTLCTHGRAHLFGRVTADKMQLNTAGCIVRDEWLRTPSIRREIRLDEFVVMPDHMHAIVWIDCTDDHAVRRGGNRPVATTTANGPGRHTIGSLVAGYKSAVTTRINATRGAPRLTVWQRGYHDHVIRDEDSLDRIRRYILRHPRCCQDGVDG